MLTLNFGVVDVPYATPPSEKGNPKAVTTTTGDVAGFLEAKYHPMEHFYQENEQKIADQLADSASGALESVLMGAPADGVSLFGAAESAIAEEFRQFIALGVLETLGYPGLPTKAALEGVNHRLKSKRGARRPSLIDTGLWLASTKIWSGD